jgi:copper chaperone
MTDAVIHIEGMSCQHCVMRIKKAIAGLAGVSILSVDIGQAKVSFDETKIQRKDIEAAVVKAGYKVKG